jgi:hypothetical protein
MNTVLGVLAFGLAMMAWARWRPGRPGRRIPAAMGWRCAHHQRGHHADSLSDLPLRDLLFGTFEYPHMAPTKCGFTAEAERRLPALLLRGESQL